MIQPQTYLNIIDNTGIKKIMCIRILGNNKKYAMIGDIIIGVAKMVISNNIIKKSSIVKALIVRTKKNIKRKDGTSITFSDNAAIIINNDNSLKGTRIFGPIAEEIRNKKYLKIISIAKEII
jgi:large subunit ribosomal protein L14